MIISAKNLTKVFNVPQKEPGLVGSFRSFFHRKYLAKRALTNATFTVERGEILGLVGANGAGKTTLVKILCGIISPSHGDVSVLGFNPWNRDNEFRRQISLIMGQKAQLWWDLPAADSFLLLRDIYDIDKKSFDSRLTELTETLQVTSLLSTPVRRLSLGERMKMELVAALLHAPKVVFLDEPTIGLDLTAQRAIRRFILKYREELNATIILTSHYMEDIEALCKRLIVVREGHFVFDGPVAQVVDRMQPYRTVTFRMNPSVVITPLKPTSGEIISFEEGILTVRVPRTDVAEYITNALQAMPVDDLSLSEDDISRSIETLMIRGDKAA